VFNGDLSPILLVEQLSVMVGKQIVPGKSLVFFDEIQACPRAIASLRFFYEQMPGLHVIAAGSLLEFALQELPSYGVGRIRSYYMFPFSFDEFLSALGQDLLLERKQKASKSNPVPEAIHTKLLQYLSVFMTIGGMPEAVARYAETGQFLQTQHVLDDIIRSLRTDFAKYSRKVPSLRLHELFNAVVLQAGRKFVYTKASEQIKDYQAKEALELLILAGWVLPVTHTSANGIPIGAEADFKKRKMLMLDTGIFQRILGLNQADLYLQPNAIFINKGTLAEHLWGLEYIKYQMPDAYPDLYYWHREGKSNAEVDFVVQKDGGLIPIEIKASGRGSMQSIRLFLEEKKCPWGYRFSTENFTEYENIKVMPLYAVSNFVGQYAAIVR
jgi:predicted AAA+ superfamily ATPase